MIFSSKAIRQAIKAGVLKIDPLTADQINSAHIDLHLEIPDGEQELVIPARGFCLAKTREKITVGENICAFMEGKSSLAKLGISIEQSSTFIEPGSDSQMTLEIFNASNEHITLTNGQPIAKMYVLRLVDQY